MKKALLVLLFLGWSQTSYADGLKIAAGPQIFGGYQTSLISQDVMFGKRLLKTDRNKWRNPPDLHLGVHLTKIGDRKSIGISLSFGPLSFI
ncbi:MAG: hypothetical protein HYT67_02110 [Candidatus Yanofskybacteria bacterium]|nr:hypothetical protein [Candidatus Yanofskybacteria bacterium]